MEIIVNQRGVAHKLHPTVSKQTIGKDRVVYLNDLFLTRNEKVIRPVEEVLAV